MIRVNDTVEILDSNASPLIVGGKYTVKSIETAWPPDLCLIEIDGGWLFMPDQVKKVTNDSN